MLSSQETAAERRIRLAKQKRKAVEEALAKTSESRLSLKSQFSYNTIKKSYLTFLETYNENEEDVTRPPLEPFTRYSFNIGKLN